jgi:hypothetical protein
MATLTQKFLCDRSNISQKTSSGGSKTGVGQDRHLLAGADGVWRHRAFIRFAIDKTWIANNCAEITDARIFFRTETSSGTGHAGWGSKPKLAIKRITSSWSEGTSKEDVWSSGSYRWPSTISAADTTLTLRRTDNLTVEVPVNANFYRFMPKGIKGPQGKVGTNEANYGWALMGASESDSSNRYVFFSRHHSTASVRPYLQITYIPKNIAPVAPVNNVPGTPKPGTPENVDGSISFEGDHSDPDQSPMNAREVRVYLKDGASPVWTLPVELQPASPAETASGRYSVPLSDALGSLKSQTDYEWDARTQDSSGAWGPYFSPRRLIRITSQTPNRVVVTNLGTVETFAGVKFGGVFSDPDGNSLGGYRIQLRQQAPAGDPIWEDELPLWDTGQVVPTAAEQASGVIGYEYTGRPCAAGTYSFRVMAEDDTGLWGTWAYGTVTLTRDYENSDPGDYQFATIADRLAPVRVALYKMGTKRGPGALLGYVDEPINLGASRYMNSAGEMYFTLPATHPYCPEIEPHQVHYAVEQWWGDRYRTLFMGLITDFDASPEEVVFYGTDYLGLLASSVDERYDPKKPNEGPTKGSKYSDKTIDSIIRDQLTYHIQTLENSQVGFLGIGTISPMPEHVTIFSTYTEALPFIVGLIDSHKQGTGTETRLYIHEKAPNSYEIRCIDHWGRDRENIQLEYGGLLNDFRVVGFGDFGTRVLGVGQKRGETAVYRKIGTAKGMDEGRFGRIAKTRFYPEVNDENDLQRRVDEAAAQVSKVGKRLALAIKADGLTVFDGWDIGDNIVINIDRGVVDTTRFGSGLDTTINDYEDAPWKRGGWWTILGAEFHFYPDGHYDTVLSVSPKKTERAPDPDLLPSRPNTVAPEWQVGYGMAVLFGEPPVVRQPSPGPFNNAFSPDFLGGVDGTTSVPPEWQPASTEPVVAHAYIDLNTGIIYILGPDGRTYATAYNPATNIPDIPGTTPDPYPPDKPIVLDLDSDITMQENGEDIVRLLVKVGYGAAPVGLDDLTHYIVQATRFVLQGTDDPDWSRGLEVQHLSPDKTGSSADIVISPVLAHTQYTVRAAARDQTGNISDWSDPVPILTTRDNEGPARPEDASLHAGMNSIGVRWSPVGAPDLSHYEVRWTVETEQVWTLARIRGTLLIIDQLANDTEYRVQVRSVDLSGNVLHDTGVPDADGNPVYETRDDTDLDAGWVDAGLATPKALGGDSLVWTDGMIQNLFAGKLRADWITAGTLTVGGGPGHVDAITVINAQGQPVGVWSTDGLRILGTDPHFYLILTDSGMKVVDITDPNNPVDRITMNPLGIDAASITFGSARGGHNLIQNSSFELGSFAQTQTSYYAWDVQADWLATLVSDLNVTIDAEGNLRMGTV